MAAVYSDNSIAGSDEEIDDVLPASLNFKKLVNVDAEKENNFAQNITFLASSIICSVYKKSTSFSVFDFKDNADASVCTRNRAYEGFENKELTFVSDCFKMEYNF